MPLPVLLLNNGWRSHIGSVVFVGAVPDRERLCPGATWPHRFGDGVASYTVLDLGAMPLPVLLLNNRWRSHIGSVVFVGAVPDRERLCPGATIWPHRFGDGVASYNGA